MDALNQRQANINKFYSLLLYGHIQNLSDDEKKKVELIFSITGGSSNFSEENTDKILEILKEAISKMPSYQICAVFITGLLLYFGNDAYRYTLDAQFKKQDYEFLVKFVAQIQNGSELLQGHKEFSKKIHKIAQKNDEVKVLGHIVPKENIDDNKNITEGRLDGDYKILSISANNTSFSIKIQNVDTEQSFSAKLETLGATDIQSIQNALFLRREISLKINARFIDGKVQHAFIVNIDNSKN